MHICHVNLASGFSGGERQTVNLICELAKREVRQTLVARKGSRLGTELDGIPGVSIRETPHFLTGHAVGDWDLIHCHDGKSVYWAWLESVIKQTPYLITRRVDNRLGNSWFTRSAYCRASAVVCLSTAVSKVVSGAFPGAKTQIIPSSYSGFSVNTVKVREIREKYAGKILVGQVGRLLEHKGYQVTIAAARQLAEQEPRVQFLFLGEGPDEAWLKAQAQTLSNVEFLGHQNDVGSWLSALDIFVFPSLTEGLGSTILEAMQLNVPVVASRAGGIPDIVQNRETGLLVEPDNPQALRNAILELTNDAELISKLTQCAKSALKRYSPEYVATAYKSLYEKILYQ